LVSITSGNQLTTRFFKRPYQLLGKTKELLYQMENNKIGGAGVHVTETTERLAAESTFKKLVQFSR